ncbi:hypothetical protein ACPOL_3551 [Acidisarcina polymorpha]|uniref:Trm112 family protein n=1 Tax=Acidisarcina polymorpha TaxID=2211140 RepID=A0A2Z5G2S7_9BACT|nr:hypothetical protein ACPOL_3551 [Acidisarcina polymorpha]
MGKLSHSTELLQMVVCPRCHQSLVALPSADVPVSLRCTGCGLQYPIVDGIPILLMDRGKQ